MLLLSKGNWDRSIFGLSRSAGGCLVPDCSCWMFVAWLPEKLLAWLCSCCFLQLLLLFIFLWTFLWLTSCPGSNLGHLCLSLPIKGAHHKALASLICLSNNQILFLAFSQNFDCHQHFSCLLLFLWLTTVFILICHPIF